MIRNPPKDRLTIFCDLRKKRVGMSAYGELAIRYVLAFAFIVAFLFKFLR
jgi:hypothetical protein